MSWNYRIVKYKDHPGCYGLHEVFYDKKDRPWGMTKLPIDFTTDGGPEEIHKALSMALRDALCKPVLEEPEKWPGKSPASKIKKKGKKK